MKEIKSAPQLPLPLMRRNAFDACWRPLILNWLIPGAGYWIIRERKRAIILFTVNIIFISLAFFELMYGAGTGPRGGVFVPRLSPMEWMPTLGSIATFGVGPVYSVFVWCFAGIDSEPIRNLTQEYGATYVMVAGLLNWLCSIDIFDRTTGRWIWRLPKDEQQIIVEDLNKESQH